MGAVQWQFFTHISGCMRKIKSQGLCQALRSRSLQQWDVSPSRVGLPLCLALNSPVPIHTHGWRERSCESKMSCLRTQCSDPYRTGTHTAWCTARDRPSSMGPCLPLQVLNHNYNKSLVVMLPEGSRSLCCWQSLFLPDLGYGWNIDSSLCVSEWAIDSSLTHKINLLVSLHIIMDKAAPLCNLCKQF